MFEVRCIVADKRLSEVLRALNGLTLEPPVVIATADPTVAALSGAKKEGRAQDRITAFIKKNKFKQVTARQMREELANIGFGRNGYSYGLKMLLKEGLLKKTKTPHTYEVISK